MGSTPGAAPICSSGGPEELPGVGNCLLSMLQTLDSITKVLVKSTHRETVIVVMGVRVSN